ncbi:MAG: hypothetical protein IKX86_04040, partial [Clostridia bacterium]|nr:hypothetical protein [Clostridia bacterium]
GLIRKDYVEPGVTGENSGTADDTTVIDETTTAAPPPSAESIDDKYWGNKEHYRNGTVYMWRITRNGWNGRPLTGPLKDAEDDEFAPFMFVISKGIPYCEYPLNEKKQQLYNEALVDKIVSKYGLDRQYCTEEIEKGLMQPAEGAVFNEDEYFEGWSEEEKEQYFETRMPVELTKIIWEVQESEEFLDALKEVYNRKELLDMVAQRTETIRNRVDESEKMLTEKGFTILWDVNDEEWKDTFTVTGAVCVAVGTKKQILELSDELLKSESDAAIYYAVKEPLTLEEVLERY